MGQKLLRVPENRAMIVRMMTIGQVSSDSNAQSDIAAPPRPLRTAVQVRMTLTEVMWSGKVEIDSNS
jgi:hypothetical protein